MLFKYVSFLDFYIQTEDHSILRNVSFRFLNVDDVEDNDNIHLLEKYSIHLKLVSFAYFSFIFISPTELFLKHKERAQSYINQNTRTESTIKNVLGFLCCPAVINVCVVTVALS